MHAAKKQESKLKFVTLDKESKISMLWEKKEFFEVCSREEVSEKHRKLKESCQCQNTNR